MGVTPGVITRSLLLEKHHSSSLMGAVFSFSFSLLPSKRDLYSAVEHDTAGSGRRLNAAPPLKGGGGSNAGERERQRVAGVARRHHAHEKKSTLEFSPVMVRLSWKK